jgi:hypothetical protein
MSKPNREINLCDATISHSLSNIRQAQLHHLTGKSMSVTVIASQIELCDLLLGEISDVHTSLAKDLEQMLRP